MPSSSSSSSTNRNRSLHLSNAFVVSSGTVTLDLTHAKVLLIHWRKTGAFMLPKGRKDVGETFEETGHRVRLLPRAIETLATGSFPLVDNNNNASQPPSDHDDACTEPIAVQQRVADDGTLKIIFWFAASGDSTAAAAPVQERGTTTPQHQQQQQDGEEFDAVWEPVGQVAGKLSWEDDRNITMAVLRAARDEGLIAYD